MWHSSTRSSFETLKLWGEISAPVSVKSSSEASTFLFRKLHCQHFLLSLFINNRQRSVPSLLSCSPDPTQGETGAEKTCVSLSYIYLSQAILVSSCHLASSPLASGCCSASYLWLCCHHLLPHAPASDNTVGSDTQVQEFLICTLFPPPSYMKWGDNVLQCLKLKGVRLNFSRIALDSMQRCYFPHVIWHLA